MNAIAYALVGRELMPWQKQLVKVATEYDPATGIPFYREVVWSTPRQSGKTTALLALEAELAERHPNSRIFYTAQSGSDARKKLVDDQMPLLAQSPLNRLVKQYRKAQGSEGIVFKNGSRIDILASSKSSGHGRIVDLGVVDEAFDDVDDRREQAIVPGMSTRPAAQLLITSTMGTDESVYLNRKVETGRRAVDGDRRSGIAYFEWSGDLETDPDDEDAWWGFMPALGRTIGLDAIRHARQSMSDDEFRRAYMNLPTVTDSRVIPKEVWGAAQRPNAEIEGRVVFAVDVAPDRSSAAVGVSDGSTVELVEHRPGVGWVVDRTVDLAEKWGSTVVVDKQSPADSFAAELADRGVDVRRFATDQVAAATGRFFDRLADGLLHVRTHHSLDAAAAAAVRRHVGDRWVWGRKSTTDITPLVAVTLAAGGAWAEDGPPILSFA